MLKPNDKIGQYQLLQKLGNSAFGEVWRAVKADALVSAELRDKIKYLRERELAVS